MFNASNVLDVIGKYFSNTAYLVLFCASVLYPFFTGTKGRKRGFIAAVVVFILLINDFVYKKFINYDGGITYYRHLWVIPYVTIIALAITDLCKRLPRLIYRGAIVIAACIIVFTSETVNPFLYYWNIPLNPKLVSEDIIKLGDKLEQIRN